MEAKPLSSVLHSALPASALLLVAELHVFRALKHFVESLRIVQALEIRDLAVRHQAASTVVAHARQHTISTASRKRARHDIGSRKPTWKISAFRWMWPKCPGQSSYLRWQVSHTSDLPTVPRRGSFRPPLTGFPFTAISTRYTPSGSPSFPSVTESLITSSGERMLKSISRIGRRGATVPYRGGMAIPLSLHTCVSTQSPPSAKSKIHELK